MIEKKYLGMLREKVYFFEVPQDGYAFSSSYIYFMRNGTKCTECESLKFITS